MSRILLVCTGNTCRSPMAEALLRSMAAQQGQPMEVRSAGVAASSGMPISSHAAETLRRKGVPLPGPSTQLTASEIDWADLVLTMTASHKQAIVTRYPEAVSKTHTLKEFAYGNDESVLADVAEVERLYAEWQTQQALGQPFGQRERERLQELARRLPDFDIADPFGGPLDVYEACAEEILDALQRAFASRNGEEGHAKAD